MLPLEQNNLTEDNEWHVLKNMLLALTYRKEEKAKDKYDKLPDNLKQSHVAKLANTYMETKDKRYLDEAAEFLTQSKLPDAWLYIERL